MSSGISQLSALLEFGGEDGSFQQSLYDFFPGIIYVYDADNKQLRYTNRKITEMLGYSDEDITSWNNDYSKFIYKDDLAHVQQELSKYDSLSDTDRYEYKCRFTRKQGDWKHFCVSGKILRRHENGKAASILFVARDINHEIQSEEEVATLKSMVNDTEGLLQFGTWVWDLVNDKVKWSKGIYSILGYEYDEKNPIDDVDLLEQHVAEEDKEAVRKTITEAIRSGQEFQHEYTVIDRHQEEKRVFCKGKPVLDESGKVLKMIGITRCITEQSRLYNSLANYKQMALEKEEFLGHGSWEFNSTSGVITWSNGMYKLFGYDAEKDKDLLITQEFYRQHMLADEYQRGQAMLRGITSDQQSYTFEFQIKTANGDIRRLETFSKIIRDRKGNISNLIGTTRDITELRNYERKLEKTIDELQKSNKDLEEFAYIASHDIQEPLRKIISFSERLKSKFGSEMNEEANKYIDRIVASTRNARLLIDGLMDFSRLSSEQDIFVKSDLNTLLQDVKTEIELKIEETGTVIQAEKLPVLEVTEVQIRQLFSNLLLNAIKFRKPTVSPVINITSKKTSLDEKRAHGLKEDTDYYTISITDNGIGFEKEYADRIFQMFQRLHGKAEFPGAGIGLALCRKICDNHNGVIFADSDPVAGTSFTVILPERHS